MNGPRRIFFIDHRGTGFSWRVYEKPPTLANECRGCAVVEFRRMPKKRKRKTKQVLETSVVSKPGDKP